MVTDILLTAARNGIYLYLKGEKLAYKAYGNTLTEELKKTISENKENIINVLKLQSKENSFGSSIIEKRDDTLSNPLLSYGQQRLWLLDQIDGGSAHYNMPGALKLTGDLDHNALNQAFSTILDRHESLRTCFSADESGEPYQVIRPASELFLAVQDLSMLEDGERESVIAERVKEEATRTFNLSDDLMLRGQLLKVTEDEHILLVTMHHIASDGWSMSILINEFSTLYRAYSQGQANPLPSLAIQYTDYAHWQRSWLQGEVLDEQLGYWEQQLADLPVAHNLPLDRSRPRLQSFAGSIHYSRIDKTTSEALSTLCQAQGATVFMGLHAAFSALLSRYSNETDIVVGSPIANREQAEIAGLIGFFVNTLVLRSDLSDNPSFVELMAQSKTMLLDAYAHQQVPFEQIVERLQPVRSVSHNPLFQVMLVLQNNEAGTLKLPGLTLGPVAQRGPEVAKYDLTLNVSEGSDQLFLKWEYNTDLFDKSTIARMADHFKVLLASMVTNPQVSVFTAEMLSKSERQQLLADWNNTAAEYPAETCIHELFEAQAASNPDATALVFDGQQLTYCELNRQANQLAHYLVSDKQVQPDTPVGICIERSLEMVVAILGVLKAGGAYVPLDPDYPAARLAYMLDDAALTTVITQAHLLDSTPVTPAQAVCLDDIELAKQLDLQPSTNLPSQQLGLTASHLAYVIYTSGSTGKPKGVMVEHRALVNRIDWMDSQYGSSPTDRILQKTPFSFDVSVWEFVWPLTVGAGLVLAKPEGHKDPVYLSELIRTEQITKLHFVPSMLGSMLSLGDFSACPSLQQVFCSGEALSLHHVQAFSERCPDVELHNLYGPTEAAIDVSYWDCGQPNDGNSVPIGRPINNIQLQVLNAQLELVPQGSAGELHIGGVGLARGYLNRPDLSAEKFIANPFYDKGNPASSKRLYKTGDLVRWLPDGNLEFLGRIDHQVKIRGFRIELGEIENSLSMHDSVKDSVVLAKVSEDGDKRLVAYVVANVVNDNNDETLVTERLDYIEDLRLYLNKHLPDHMVPATFVLLEQLPLTPNGKVDRKALPEPDLSRLQGDYVAPCTETEIALCDIWQDVLGVERVGVTDNFFMLGGHSLTALTLISRMNLRLGANIKMKDVFATPNIKDLIASADFTQSSIIYQQLEGGLIKLKDIQNAILAEPRYRKELPDTYEDFYPLSSIQQSMVFFAQAQPEAPVYHDQFPYVLHWPNFEIVQFRRAIELLCQSHPILRTSFDITHFEIPLQMVHSQLPIDVVLEDLSDMNTDLQQAHIDLYCKNDLQNKFLFQNDQPLWRVHLFSLGGDQVCFILSFQHAILDGWSVNALTSELMQIYTDLGKSVDVKPKYNSCSYKDYIAINLESSSSDNTKSHWEKYLHNYSRMKLPFNYSGKQISDEVGMRVRYKTVSRDLLRSLQHRGDIDGFTIKEMCLSAYVYLLSLLTGDSDVLTGVVTHDRPELQDADKVLGCFLNTLPLRLPTRTSVNRLDLLTDVQSFLRKTKEHELFLGDISRLVGEISSYGNPLFDTIFNFTDFPVATSTDSDNFNRNESLVSQGNMLDIARSEMTNTWLDFEVHKRGENGMVVQIKYAPKYFNQKEIDLASELYLEILEVFATEQNELEAIDFVSSVNATESTFNQTDCDYPFTKTLHQLFEEQVLRTPDAVALRQHGQSLSYEELNHKANQIGRLLFSRGVKPGDQVGVIMARSFDLIASLFGILKAGAAYVPMEPSYPLARKQAIEASAELTALLVDDSAEEHNEKYIHLDNETLDIFSPENINLEKDALELAYIIYTSGSTGTPKGVRIAHHAAVNLVNWVNSEFSIGTSDVLLFITSVSFDLSVYDIFGMLSAGGSIVIAEQSQIHNSEVLFELINKEKVTFWDSVPTTLNHLVSELSAHSPGSLGDSLRLVFLSGDWIPTYLPSKTKQHFPNAQIISLGGATEGTVWSNYYPVDDDSEYRTSIPYGKPIDNNRFYILDSQQNPVVDGVVGELYIAGVGVANGYENDEEKTNTSFFRDPFVDKDINGQPARMYKTGDLGRLLPCGNMELHGRIDHQVKLRGFRIELNEIESIINQCPFIKEAVVSLVKSVAGSEASTQNQYLVAYVIANNSTDLSTEHLESYLSDYLPEYMIPKIFIALDALPLTPNGKVDRKALPEPDLSLLKEEFVAPRTETEKVLCEIWQEVLGVERVGVTDNFFQLGGHSLLATRVVSRIHQALNIDLPLNTIFNTQSLEKLAQALLSLDSGLDRPPLISVSREQRLLPSYGQQRLWLLDKIDGSSAHYNMPAALKLSGKLDHNALNQAFSSIVERHESLRTCFAIDEAGEPYQVIRAASEFSLVNHDLSMLEEGERELAIAEQVRKEAALEFDLSNDLMLRAQLLKVAEEAHILLVTMHHIASDGWSMSILINEFSTLYRAYSQGQDNPLPLLAIQYADYAQWQRSWLQGEVLDEQLGYWQQQLADLPVVHSLPLDRPRPQLQSFVGGSHYSRVDNVTSQALSSLCQAQGATVFMGLHAAFSALLSRYSNETDIVMGSPIANREQAEVADLIGFFVNTLVLRSDLSANPNFSELLAQSKTMLIDAYAHQQVPFEQIVERLQPERSLNHSPLFQVMLILQNNEAGTLELPGLTLSPVGHTETIARYDLTLNVSEGSGGLFLNWEYNTDLFDASTVARMAEHFNVLLASMVATPQTSVFATEMLSEAERHQQLVDWNTTAADYPAESCIHELFEAQVENTPDATALVFDGQSLSYGELNTRANQLAHYLVTEKQVKPDTLVGICLERSLEMVVAILGVLKVGGAYVPLDPDYPEARLAYMLDDAQLSTVITQSHLLGRMPTNREQPVCLDKSEIAQQLARQPSTNLCSQLLGLTASHLAYVIYTSGSTGQPKGVMVEHSNVVNFLSGMRSTPGIQRDDRLLAVTSTSFDIHGLELFLPLIAGAKIVLASKTATTTPHDLIQLIADHSVTLMQATPATWKMLLDASWQPASPIKVLCGGEALSQSLASALLVHPSIELWNLYGPTETTIWSCAKQIQRDDERILMGRPIANTSISVVTNEMSLVPVGVPGELLIGGAGLARGYLNRPDLTADKFIANPFYDRAASGSSDRLYKTGDLVRWLPDGNLEFLGRIDHQVKVRGFRIELGEIENSLSTHDTVKDVVVLAKESGGGDRRLVAYVVTDAVEQHNDETAGTEHQDYTGQLRQHVGESLPDYMVPSAFVLLEQLPLTPNGKVDRKALPEPDLSQRQAEYIAPRTETEKVLCEIWQEVLGIERVGVTDNFFQLGGHSLLYVKLLARMEKEFSVKLSIAYLFTLNDLHTLSTHIDAISANFSVDTDSQELEFFEL